MAGFQFEPTAETTNGNRGTRLLAFAASLGLRIANPWSIGFAMDCCQLHGSVAELSRPARNQPLPEALS